MGFTRLILTMVTWKEECARLIPSYPWLWPKKWNCSPGMLNQVSTWQISNRMVLDGSWFVHLSTGFLSFDQIASSKWEALHGANAIGNLLVLKNFQSPYKGLQDLKNIKTKLHIRDHIRHPTRSRMWSWMWSLVFDVFQVSFQVSHMSDVAAEVMFV